MSYIEELREVIRHLHGAEATHAESVPVKEQFQGRTVWDGVVEVFTLHGHPRAERVYAWSHDVDSPKPTKRHVTILHTDDVSSPVLAVRAFIIQEFRNRAIEN